MVLSDHNELNPLAGGWPTGPVKAIIINHGDHAYAKIRYDAKTMDTFTKELSKFDNYLERATVWRHIWIAVMDCQISSLQYLEMVATQLPTETVEQTITDVLMKLSSLISNYIPSEKAAESKERMMNMLLQCLQNN